MTSLTDYFRSTANNVNTTNSSADLSIETFENQNKVSKTTPKSKRGKSKGTPKGKDKISPRRSPLEGFNILFKGVAKNSEDSKHSRMEGDISSAKGEEETNDSVELIEIEETSTNPRSSSKKMNAFEILMMSRNKVIGSNSPGKELPEQEEANISSPTKILARKRLLQTWSDSIKVKRRKLDDDEVDKYIKVKLNTRKERMKSLLQIDDNSMDATKNTPKPKKRNHSSRTKDNMKKNEPNGNLPAPSESKLKDISNGTEKIEEKSDIVLSKSLSSGDDFEPIKTNSELNTPKVSNKHGQKKKLKPTSKSSSIPKCTKTWKMKIKLIDKDETSNSNEKNDVIILDDCEDINETPLIEEKNQNGKDKLVESPETKDEVKIIEEVENCGRVLRNRTSLNKNKNIDYFYSSEESNDGFEGKKKGVKMAPVFAKAVPKPKIDPEVLEARRKFLMSDMPDSLRKKIEKQTSYENIENDFDAFPKTSHITQEEKDHPLWNLPDPLLPIKPTTQFSYDSTEFLCKSLIDNAVIEPSRYEESERIKHTKTIMRDMKLENSKYPVNRAFRLLKEKNGITTDKVVKKTTPKRGRKSRNSSEKIVSKNAENQVDSEFLMWTEKYKPRSSEDFFGNTQAVSSLKKWLERWKEVLETGKRRKRQFSSDSESDFTISDVESVYDRSLSTTVVLTGPCGTGKSSSVYAVCNELGLNVLELNASSRRMGKQVIQELQEATQSHQVRKTKTGLDSFTKSVSKKKEDEEKHKSKKMCVLLIEDIDIVFDQDDGFINAITQISTTSKRPIILTTTNEDSVHSQKFTNDFKTIRFHPLSVECLGIWLQILCVLEGIFVDLPSIGELLEYNKGDLRKTILELQYWIQSGGQISKHKTLINRIFEPKSLDDERSSTPVFDDAETISLNDCEEKFNNYRLHSNILSDLMTFQLEKFYNIPFQIDLKKLWWNMPKFLYPAKPKPETVSPKSSKKNRKRLKMVSDLYDSAASFDVSYTKIGFKCDDPVCRKRWHCGLQDSLEIEEKSTGFSINQEILELNHYLTNGYLESCKNKFIYEFSQKQRFCNMAVPGLDQERQLDNDHKYETQLLNPVPSVNILDRKSVALDYLPCLRTIARTESVRAKNNVKRHNRFNNYLSNLNISCDTPILDFAIRTFSTCTE